MFVHLDNGLRRELRERERERERVSEYSSEIIVQVRIAKELRLHLGAKVPDDFHIFSSLANAWSSC